MTREGISTGRVVATSLLVDLLDVATNLVVALLTGSAVVFAEMAQGLADALGSLLLMIGHRRARRPRDTRHPFGYGREVFFWSLLSALTMLFLGAGFSFWRGWSQLVRPQALERPWLAMAVVILSVTTNGYAFSCSVRRLRREDPSLRKAFHETSQQLVKTALLQDGLGTLSALLGLVSLTLYLVFGSVFFDALGALVLAALMVAFAVVLVSQARSLITGRAVPAELREELLAAVRTVPQVARINRLDSVFFGSREVLVDVDLDLVEHLTTTDVEAALDRVQAALHNQIPEVTSVRVDLNSPPKPQISQ